MPTVYYAIHIGGTMSTAGTWSVISAKDATRVGGAVVPTTGDTCILDDYSGNVLCNANITIATLNMTGYTGTLNTTGYLTLTAGATLQGLFTGTNGIIVTGGGVTLAGTCTNAAGTFNISITTAAQTLVSGGNTWTGKLTLSYAGITTFNGNWINTGLVTLNTGANVLAQQNGTETLTAQGGLTVSSAMGATSAVGLIITGGTWSGQALIYGNLTINPSVSNVTVSGSVGFGTGVLTYTPSTYSVITTGSTVAITMASTTFNTDGIIWNNISIYPTNYGTSITITLTSPLTMTGYLGLTQSNNTETFNGAFNITCGYLYIAPATAGGTFVFTAGQTLNITKGIWALNGPTAAGVYSYMTIKSSSTGVPTFINYTGTLANEVLGGVIFTDVYATATTVPFYGASLLNYSGGTLTRTSGIKNVNATNIEKPINNFTGL